MKEYRNDQGQLHREDGPAINSFDGYQAWYINGKRHRLDGPAKIYPDGYKAWWINGKRHRSDGPAITYSDGRQAWFINGIQITEEQFKDKKYLALVLITC